MCFGGPVGFIKSHEVEGPSKHMRFLGPSKHMRFSEGRNTSGSIKTHEVFGSIKSHEVEGPSKHIRFLGPSKHMRFLGPSKHMRFRKGKNLIWVDQIT